MRASRLLVISLVSMLPALPLRADERPAQKEMKGMELYSWQDADGGWVFALLPGTNRLKAEAEVKQKENQIAGTDALEKKLLQLAEGEQVFWHHREKGFAYPDTETCEEVAAATRRAKVELDGGWPRPKGPAEGPQHRSRPEETCYELVQDRIAWDYEGNRRWTKENVERLCAGSSRPREPGRCFQQVMHEGVEWGRGTRWEWEHALALCAGTDDARETIHCFSSKVHKGTSWDQAIEGCKQPLRND